jgi:hypothetical protein
MRTARQDEAIDTSTGRLDFRCIVREPGSQRPVAAAH